MKKILLLSSALFLTAVSYGQILISWEVTGIKLGDGTHTAPYTVAGVPGAHVSGGALTLGSGVDSSPTANRYGFIVLDGNEQGDLAGAIAHNHYLQFTVSAASGYVLNLSSLELHGETNPSGADDVALMTSVDGFSDGNDIANLTGRHVVGAGDFGTDGTNGFGAPIDLSASEYQNLSSITFRIYGWNTSGGATYIRNLSGDDLVVNGTTTAVAVPEPATYALLLGLVALGICWGRRRRAA